jgi:hypothetical protein
LGGFAQRTAVPFVFAPYWMASTPNVENDDGARAGGGSAEDVVVAEDPHLPRRARRRVDEADALDVPLRLVVVIAVAPVPPAGSGRGPLPAQLVTNAMLGPASPPNTR